MKNFTDLLHAIDAAVLTDVLYIYIYSCSFYTKCTNRFASLHVDVLLIFFNFLQMTLSQTNK